MQVFDGMFSPAGMQIALGILIKAGIALALAAVIGWERELHQRPAGMRTHMLLMLGVILFAESSKAFSPATPDRIAAQILTGVGFLGAGTIMRAGPEVKGLTSAASVWATAAIGVIVSVGGPFILVAVIATLVSLFVLTALEQFERKVIDAGRPRTLRVNVQQQSLISGVFASLVKANIQVKSLKILEAEAGLQLAIQISGDPVNALEAISGVAGVNSASWET